MCFWRLLSATLPRGDERLNVVMRPFNPPPRHNGVRRLLGNRVSVLAALLRSSAFYVWFSGDFPFLWGGLGYFLFFWLFVFIRFRLFHFVWSVFRLLWAISIILLFEFLNFLFSYLLSISFFNGFCTFELSFFLHL